MTRFDWADRLRRSARVAGTGSISKSEGQAIETTLRAYLEAKGVSAPLETIWSAPGVQTPAAVCFAERGGRLLLLRRRKPPFAGHLVAPGGKIEPGEDPEAAAAREIREETGLGLEEASLRLIVSEQGPPHHNWLLFVLWGRLGPGRPRSGQEGALAWVPLRTSPPKALHPVDQWLWSYLRSGDRWRATVRFSPTDGRVVSRTIERLC